MNTNIWLFRKFKTINKKRFKEHIDIIQKNSGKSKIYIYTDILFNFLKYGCGYTDYFRCNYINATNEEKKTFATAKKFYKIIHYFNDDKYVSILNDKIIFNNYFKEYLQREFIDIRISSLEELSQFLNGKENVFAKDPTSYGGHGVRKIRVADYPDITKLKEELLSKKQVLIEQEIKQTDVLNSINPNCVNTLRVITLYKDNGEVVVLNNALRINQGKQAFVGSDNDMYCSFGEDGKINSNVIDDYANVYTTHPLTGINFADICIPDMQKAFEMCKEAAKKIPNLRYVGWDVAFTDNGPVFIEGNEYPGYGLIQFYKLKNSRTGHIKEIEDALGRKLEI